MGLVALLEPAQDADGVLDAGLIDKDRLETSLQRGVLLDVLAVLVQRGGADGVQLATRQHGLEHVGGVHAALGRARADQRVHLVDEEDDLPLGLGDLLEHGLEPLLKLAAILGPGHQRTDVQRDQLLVAQTGGHVALDDALGQPFGDGRLAHARLADEHRVVLGAPAQDLDDAADLLVAADDRVELALARILGQVAAILGERLVLGLRVVAGDALVAANAGQRLHDGVVVDAVAGQQIAHPVGGRGQRHEQMLGRDILVLHARRNLLGLLDHGHRGLACADLERRAATRAASSPAPDRRSARSWPASAPARSITDGTTPSSWCDQRAQQSAPAPATHGQTGPRSPARRQSPLGLSGYIFRVS